MRIVLALFISACIPVFAGQGSSAGANFDITGTLVNANTGETVRQATVVLSPTWERQNIQSIEVGADGRFSFLHLTPGKYALAARARRFPEQLFEEHTGFSTAIAVGSGKTSNGLVFKMNPDAAISGQVMDEHNEPIRNAQVMLFSRNTDNGKRGIRLHGRKVTDDQGRYYFNHLTTGTYYVAVSAQPWFRQYVRTMPSRDPNQSRRIDPALDVAYPVTYYPNVTDSDGAGAIMLHPGDRIGADFALTPVRALHVILRTGDNSGAPAMFMQHVFGIAEIGASGPIVAMRQGSGELEATGLAPGSYTVRQNGRESDRNAQELDLRGDAEVDATGAAGLEQIQGRVTFEGPSIPKRAFVQLVDMDSEQRITSLIHDDGSFELQPTHAGRYAVVIANTPRFAIRNLSATGARLNGRTLEFTGSQPVQLTILASEGIGTINGTVFRDGKPISGAMVVLVPADPGNNNPLFRRDQSDSDGTFTLPQVVPGKYSVIAIQNGWDLEWATPEVLRPYLRIATPVQVDGNNQYDVQVTAQ